MLRSKIHFALAFAFLVSAPLVACSSSAPDEAGAAQPQGGADGEPSAASCTPTDAPRCGDARHVGDVDAFLAEQKQLVWQAIASSESGAISVSVDLIADADLTIDASALSEPARCASTDAGAAPSGCGRVVFREDAFPHLNDTRRVSGVGCAEPRKAVRRGWGELCAKLTIARGTAFRIRNVVLDNYPEPLLSTVEIVSPCAAPCASGEARCEATQLCLPLGYDTCAYCEGKPVTACACRAACDVRADGSKCSFDSAPDAPVSGACNAGVCVAPR